MATKRFIKLFVDVNKSIFQANHLFCNFADRHQRRSVRQFLVSEQTKKRKPKPAVKEHFRKFPFYLFFEILNKKGAFKLPPLK